MYLDVKLDKRDKKLHHSKYFFKIKKTQKCFRNYIDLQPNILQICFVLPLVFSQIKYLDLAAVN